MQPRDLSNPGTALWKTTALGAVLVLAVFVAYFPALHGQFVCDDLTDVVGNLALHNLAGLRAIWLQPGMTAQYYPLSFTTFWLNYQAGKLDPFGYHLVNLLLHTLNSLLLWRILRILKIPGAWLAAGLFALHPVGVESVAYINERKNLLSAGFFFCSLLAAIKFWLPDELPNRDSGNCQRSVPPQPGRAENSGGSGISADSPAPSTVEPWPPGVQPRSSAASAAALGHWKFYGLTFLLYCCALLCKTAVLPLPAVILLVVWWRRRPAWRDVAWLLPLALAGLAMGLITMRLENHLVEAAHPWTLSPLDRCLLAAHSLWFYPGKLIWPHPLIYTYPRWTIRATDWTAWMPVLGLVAGLWILWRHRAGWGRPCLFALGYFVIMLFLMLGFFNIYLFRFTFVCDHFQYLASAGPLTLAAAGAATARDRWGRGRFSAMLPAVAAASLLSILTWLTWQQAAKYASPQTLWQTMFARNPACFMAVINLGNCYAREPDRLDEALALDRLAIRLDPYSCEAVNNLGFALAQKGLLDQAIHCYRQSLQLNPRYQYAAHNLATAFAKQGRFGESIKVYQEAIRHNPHALELYNNLAWLLATCSDPQYRDGLQAVTLVGHACEATGYQEPVFIGTLAAANAEAGRFASAIAYAKLAEQAANQAGQPAIAQVNRSLLEHYYLAGKPYHQDPPAKAADR